MTVSDKRPGLPDWWRWVPSSDFCGALEEVMRDGRPMAEAWKDGSFTLRIRAHSTEVEAANYASIDEAKDACERAYLALVGVVGKGGG